MVTKTQIAQAQIYNGGLPIQYGGSAMSQLQRANQMAKQYKVVTKGDAIAGILGVRPKNKVYIGGVDLAKQAGYGFVDNARTANTFAKKYKVVSKAGDIAQILIPGNHPILKGATNLARQGGYGKKRRTKK